MVVDNKTIFLDDKDIEGVYLDALVFTDGKRKLILGCEGETIDLGARLPFHLYKEWFEFMEENGIKVIEFRDNHGEVKELEEGGLRI